MVVKVLSLDPRAWWRVHLRRSTSRLGPYGLVVLDVSTRPPDTLTISKGLGNGFPVAAVVCTREIADALNNEQREMFLTFGGNPVACQAAIAVLDTIANEHLQAQVLRVGNKLKLVLQTIAFRNPHCITEVRGEGMFLGVCFFNPQVASAVSQRMYDNHRVLTSCDAHVIVIKPPLCWDDEQVEEICVALETSII